MLQINLRSNVASVLGALFIGSIMLSAALPVVPIA
jgi:hypothetical protein